MRLTVHVAGMPPDAVIAWAGDGAKLLKRAAPGVSLGGSDTRHSFELTADGHRHWLRADVRSADGKLLLLGNPLYLVEGSR